MHSSVAEFPMLPVKLDLEGCVVHTEVFERSVEITVISKIYLMESDATRPRYAFEFADTGLEVVNMLHDGVGEKDVKRSVRDGRQRLKGALMKFD